MHFENNNNDIQICQPSFKRIRLVQSTDEKNYQDEDNASDFSQDE